MSHRWDCPTEDEARYRARRDAQYDARDGWGETHRTPYGDCHESNKAYRDAYRREFDYEQEQIAEERRVERAREARRQEEAYWEEQYAQQAQQEAEERAYWEEQYTGATNPPEGDAP